MPRELRRLARARRLRAVRVCGRPAWCGDGLVAVALGVGPARAGTSASAVLDEVVPSRVLVTGVAGGIDPRLHVGDVLVPAAVLDLRTGRTFVPPIAAHPSSRSSGGLLVTVERVVAGGAGAGGLPPGTAAVDMESAAVAAAAEERGIPWDVVRGISDTEGTLTPEVAGILRADGSADLRRAAGLVARRPLDAWHLLRLGVGSARALRAAAAAVEAGLGAWAPPEAHRADGHEPG